MSTKAILLIEDNETYRKMLKMRLEANGYEVLTAEDGLVGLDIARRDKPDLIILDLMLPRMDGHTLCRLIKFDQNIRHIPILMLTCKNMVEDVNTAIDCHVDAFLLKTTRSEVLLATIEKLVSGGEIRA
jgi:adenylate cyclase